MTKFNKYSGISHQHQAISRQLLGVFTKYVKEMQQVYEGNPIVLFQQCDIKLRHMLGEFGFPLRVLHGDFQCWIGWAFLHKPECLLFLNEIRPIMKPIVDAYNKASGRVKDVPKH